MVRIARGDITTLLPDGVTLREAPADLVLAIQHASSILNWNENLPEKEVPPRYLWPFPDEIDAWFGEVKIARDQERNSTGGETANMESNAWTPDDE